MLDALIIGAGPAGASCALWLERLGFSVMLADARPLVGGLLNDSPYRNDWIATQPGVTGPDLAEGIGLALAASGVPLVLGSRARTATRIADGFEVAFDMPEGRPRTIAARHLVIATGVQARRGGFDPSPQILIGPGRQIANQDFSGKTVAILGGGDNAFENYLSVKKAGAEAVHVYARTVRAARKFSECAETSDVRTGPYTVDAAALTVEGRRYDMLLVMYGWEPVPVFVDDLDLARNEKGFLLVDFATCATSAPGVFAVGEVAARSHPCVVTAMADGIAAAKAIQHALES